MKFRNISFLFNIIILFANASRSPAQSTREEVLRECERVAAAIGEEFDAASAVCRAPRPNGSGLSRWAVHVGEKLFVVDGTDGRIRGYSNLGLSRQLRSASLDVEPFFRNDSQIWSRCEGLRSAIGAESVEPGRIRHPGSDRAETRLQVIVEYEASPFGFRTNGNGNSFSVSLDRRTGQVVQFSSVSGWIYETPRVLISADVACELASQIRGVDRRTVQGSVLQYSVPNAEFGSTRGGFFHARRLRLAFNVQFSDALVLIDSETGECLGGALAAAGEKKRVAQVPRPDQPVNHGIAKQKSLVTSFLRDAQCPPEGFDSISYGMKGSVVAYCNKRGYETSEIWISQGIIHHALIRAKVQTAKKAISTSVQAIAALRKIMPGISPKAAKVTFEKAKKGSWDKWVIGQKIVQIDVKSPGKMASVHAAFVVATGQLVIFSRY